MFSERIYEKMYNGSRSKPALERGVTQADESRRRGVIMEAIAGVDIAVWDVKAQALGVPLYQALGAVRSSVHEAMPAAVGRRATRPRRNSAGYAVKGFTAAKMRVVRARRIPRLPTCTPGEGRPTRPRSERRIDGRRTRLAGGLDRHQACEGA